MFVRNYMLPLNKLTTVRLDESLKDALNKLEDGDFMSIPVVDEGIFYGILMKEAIYRVFFDGDFTDKDRYLENTRVESIYRKANSSINDFDKIDRASYVLKELRTPFLPVFDLHKNFVGILTHFAIFSAYTEIFGMNKGNRIVINTTDMPGQMAKLTELLRREEANILNFALVDPNIMGVRKVVLRVETDDFEDLLKKIEKSGFKVGEVEK